MDKPFAITLDVGSSRANHTGTWRSERPVYVDGLPPCNHACPAGEQIQAWLYAAEDGSYETARRRLVSDNPFPAVMGRIRYHPCETACNRAELDSAVGINSVERFLGDEAIKQGWQLPPAAAPTGRRILIVGAGPSGLSAAYHLRQLGHEVLRCLPGQCRDQDRDSPWLRDRLRLLQGLRALRRRVPEWRARHGTRTNLTPPATARAGRPDDDSDVARSQGPRPLPGRLSVRQPGQHREVPRSTGTSKTTGKAQS